MSRLLISIALTSGSWSTAMADVQPTKPVGILLERHLSESSSEREVAAYGLGALKSQAAIDPLRKRLNDEEREVRAAAAVALLQFGVAERPVLDTLGATLTHKPDPLDLRSLGLSFRVEMRLIEMPAPANTTVPALIGLLKANDQRHSELVDITPTLLALYGSHAIDAVPVLIQRLNRLPKDASVRSSVAPIRIISALRAVGSEAKVAVAALEEAMRSESPVVAVEAATAIAAIQPDHLAALARIRQSIRAGETNNYSSYLLALVEIREQKRIQTTFVPVLIEAIGQDRATIREQWQCIRLLGEIGPAAKEAIPTLRRALRSSDSLVRTHAAIAAMRIDTSIQEEARPVLRAALQKGSRDEADVVTKFFQEMPPKDVETILSLRTTLDHSDYAVACQAAVALLRASPSDADARSLLLRLLKVGVRDDPTLLISLNMGSRASAAIAVARAKFHDMEVRAALIDLLRNTEMLPVIAAADAIRQMDNR